MYAAFVDRLGRLGFNCREQDAGYLGEITSQDWLPIELNGVEI